MNLPDDFVFTQSNLQNYLDCPYRFYLRYICQIQWPALIVDEALEFERRGQAGARFHRLVQQYLTGIPEGRISQLASADPHPQLSVWWDNFLAVIPHLLSGDRWIETVLSTSLAKHRLVAKYDLILVQDKAHLMIFDWKTSQNLPRKDWLLGRVQTKVYRFLLAQAGQSLIENQTLDPGSITMNYWFAAYPKSLIQLPYDQTTCAADQNYLFNLIQEIIDTPKNAYHQTPDPKHCRYCVYRSHCDRGTEAGGLDGLEDVQLEQEEIFPDLDFTEIGEIEF